MASTQPGQNSSTVAAMTSGSVAMMAARVGGHARPPAQVLMALMDKLTALLTAMVNPANQAQHDAQVAQLRDEVALAKEGLAAEDVMMAAEQAALDAQAQRIQLEAF